MSSLKCSADCALTKCSGNLFHNFTVEGKEECKWLCYLATYNCLCSESK